MPIIADDSVYERVWYSDCYTDLFLYNSRFFEYPPAMHLEKLNMSITEAAIATKQRIERDDYFERTDRRD